MPTQPEIFGYLSARLYKDPNSKRPYLTRVGSKLQAEC